MQYAVSLDSRVVALLRILGERCYASAQQALEAGDLPNAERLFAVVCAVLPRDFRGWAGLAVTKERCGNWRAAAGLQRVGSVLAEEPSFCQFGLGRALARLGRDQQAARAFDAAEAATSDCQLLRAIEHERNAA